MTTYIQQLNLDVSTTGRYKFVYAKQGDRASRFVNVTMFRDGEKIVPESGLSAKIRAVKPDGTSIYNPATINEDGTITAELTAQTLAVNGDVMADIVLVGSNEEVLSSVSFIIRVEEAPLGTVEPSSSEFLELMDLLLATEEASREAGTSAASAAASKSDAEAYANGKRNGQAVPSTDPAYHNNAKYYAEQAETELHPVKYVAQTLSDTQKAQARQNINAAAPDGYYGESGGVMQYSTNFLGKNAPQNAHDIAFRPTASQFSGQSWSADSIGGQTAVIERIKGKTLVWNQLVDDDTAEVTVPSGHKYRLFDKDGADAIITSTGTVIAVIGGEDMVFDLTRMFGAGNEPATADEFKVMFPMDCYEYNEGELLSFNGTGLITNGFNQWDEEWEVGSYSTTDGTKMVHNTRIRSKNYIRVLPNTVYGFRNLAYAGSSGAHILCCYDENKHFISGQWRSDYQFTTPERCHYVTFAQNDVYGAVYKDDISVHLAWSGIRNGEYEPYWSNALTLPVTQYFPDGMKSVGAVYDELTKDKAVQRIGSRAYQSGDEDNSTVVTDGTTTYYPLAEPVETPISPALNLTYKVDDFGTEMLLPENGDEPVTAPMDADIVYQIDYEAQVRNSDSLNISKASMDSFIAAFNASGIGTITQIWDAANKKYAYTVTAAQPEEE